MDTSTRRCARVGFLLLAFSLPLGLSFEALHALKVQVYLGSSLRRELWTLAHAHGAMLGLMLLTYAAIAPHLIESQSKRSAQSRLLIAGAVCMPLAGGILNTEGDPSFGIFLVPIGALALCLGLAKAALAS